MRHSKWSTHFFALHWWSKSEAVLLSRLSSRGIWKIYVIFAVLGVSMRLYTQAQPFGYVFHGYDFQSYLLVAQSISELSNPYSTGRYNYGPIWAIILWLIRLICGNELTFRLGLASVLILTDLGISLWLKRNGYLLASLFLLISPISIAVTARHLQFDNLAVLLALLSVSQISRVKSNSFTKHDIWSCLLLALSIMTKHIFILFPLWLALRQTSLKKKILYLFFPSGLFLMSLIPFWLDDPKSVLENVITYSSLKNGPFFYALLPDGLAESLVATHLATLIFLSIVVLVGVRLKHLPIIQLPLVYMITIVVFSSAIADQYLAIPVAAALVFLNFGFCLWLALADLYFAGNPLTQNWWGFRTAWDWTAKDWMPYSTPDWTPVSTGFYRDQFVFLFFGWLCLMNRLRKSQDVEGETQHQIPPRQENRYKHLYIVFLTSILVLSLPFVVNLLPTTQSTSYVYEQQSKNEGTKVDAGEPLCEALIKGEEITIRLTGYITELGSYQNLFQTSYHNAGIRLEISDLGEAVLLIGTKSGFSLVSIPKKLETGVFDLSIRIKDGKKVFVTFLNEKTEKTINGLHPKCDNIFVGYGYDASRVVKGEVKFVATAPSSVPRFVPRWIDNGLRVDWFRALIFMIFYSALFFAAFKLSDETEEKPESLCKENDRF